MDVQGNKYKLITLSVTQENVGEGYFSENIREFVVLKNPEYTFKIESLGITCDIKTKKYPKSVDELIDQMIERLTRLKETGI